MPTYEYRCPKGHEFEEFQRMSDPPVAACPECGAEAERLLSGGAGLLFKGSGFYITDYRSDSYKKAAAADGKSGGTGSAGAAGSPAGGSSAAGASSSSAGGTASTSSSGGSSGGAGS